MLRWSQGGDGESWSKQEAAPLDGQAISGEQADLAVYHYYPPPEQVRAWLDQAGLAIEEEGTGDGYAHLLARKNA